MNIEQRVRGGLPQVGYVPFNQIHAHSTGNRNSTAQNEADYMSTKDINTGYYTHLVGNGRVIHLGAVNRGAYDVGGGWNNETYAAVELIESHRTQTEFNTDYKLYIELLRLLATEANIPKTLDSSAVAGIKTHEYCTYHQPYNQSDHVDPYGYLAIWGISRAQFKKDVENGLGTSSKGTTTVVVSKSTATIQTYNQKQSVDVATLNVRAAQNTSSAIVGTLRKGQVFNATRICKDGENVNGYTTWFEVNGKGWVSGALVSLVKEAPKATVTKPVSVPNEGKFIAESATFYPNCTINVRSAPSTSSAIVATYKAGDSVKYNAYCVQGGYVWIRYVGGSGQQRYMAIRESVNGKAQILWGSIK